MISNTKLNKLVFIVLFGIICTIAIVSGFAAISRFSVEPEDGITENIESISDINASGGSYIKYGGGPSGNVSAYPGDPRSQEKIYWGASIALDFYKNTTMG